MEIGVGGTVSHIMTSQGKMVIGTPSKGGELTIPFDAEAPFDSQKPRIENAIRLLEYAKLLKETPALLPNMVVKDPGVKVDVA